MAATKLPPINYDALNHLFKKLPFEGKCKECNQVFDDETYYFCHQPCHQNNYKRKCKPELYEPNCFQCSLCKKVATNFTNLRYHYQYHAARRFQCLKCEYNAHSLAEVRRHVQKHLDTKLFPCELCPRQYPDSKSLKEHLMRHHKNDAMYICSQCVRSFKDVNQFSIHLDKHYKEAAREGKEPGPLFNLRTGSTPSGETVSSAFRIRKKKKKRFLQNPITVATASKTSVQPRKPDIEVVHNGSSKQYSSLLDLIKSQVSTSSATSQPEHPITNGMKTYSTTRATHPFPERKVNRILMGNPCKFGPVVPRFVTNNSNSVKNGESRPGTSVNKTSIKTIDVGTFEPPTVDLADFIETE